jgi:hypothetical protein
MSRVAPSSTTRVDATQPSLGGIKDFEGEYYDFIADNLATLNWSNAEDDNVIINGPSDFALLCNFKNALLALWADFPSEGSHVIVDSNRREDFNRRLLLLEHEI